MPKPISISINYSAQVNEAIKAANDIQKEFGRMSQATKDQIIKTAELTKAVKYLGETADKELKKATAATKAWNSEMTRMGVFVNKTMASMAAAIQSFGTAIKGSLSVASGGVTGVFGGAQGLITGFSKSVADFVGTGGFLQGLSKALAAGASGFVKLGTDIGTFIIKGIGTVMSTVPKLLGELTQLGGSIAGLGAGLLGSFLNMGGIAAGLFITGFTNAAGAVQKAFGSILEGVTGLVASAFSGVGDTIAAALGGAIEIVGAFADRIASIISDVGSKIADILGKSIAAGLAIALPIAVKGAEFRDKLSAAFGVVIGQLGEKEFEGLVQKAKGVAIDMGISLSQVPQALFKQVSYGFTSVEDTIASLTAATKLAAVGNVDLYESINAINISIAAYGAAAGTATEVTRKLFNATRTGRLEIEDLTEHLGLVVGSAEAAGIAYDELLAVINLGNRTLASSTVVFGISNAIKSLQDPTKKAAEDFKGFFDNIQLGDGTLRSFKKVIEELRKSGLAADPKAFAAIFPDVRGARAVRAIMSQVGDDFENYDKLLAQITDDYTTFDQAAKFSLNTVEKHFVGLGAQIVSVGDDFVQKFKEPIILAFDALKGIIGDFSKSLLDIDPKVVHQFTQDIVDFVAKMPGRLKGVAEGFRDVVDWIKRATIAAKDFLDLNLNLSDVIKAMLAGDWSNAWDLIFGSPAITKMKNFFSEVMTEVKEIWTFIERVSSQLFDVLKSLLGGMAEQIEDKIPFLPKGTLTGALGIGGGAGGGGGPGGAGGFSVGGAGKLAMQTAGGVNPVQIQSDALVGGAKAATAGAIVGGKIGSMIAPGIGTVIGVAIGGLIAGIAEYVHILDEGTKKQQELNEQYDKAVAAWKKETELLAQRQAAQKEGSAAVGDVNSAFGEVRTIQAKIARRIQEANEERAPVIERIAKQEEEIAKVNAKVAEAVEAGHAVYQSINGFAQDHLSTEIDIEGTLRAHADAVGENLGHIEYLGKMIEREIAVAQKTIELRKGYNARVKELTDGLNVLLEERAQLVAPKPKEYINRGSNLDVLYGKPIFGGANDNTRRDVSTVGSKYESELLRVFDDLIKALEKNVAATDAHKEALKASNIDKSNPYLSINAKAAARRAEKAQQKGYASVVNQQYGSTYGATPDAGFGGFSGGFGFGGSAQEAVLRQMAFGGGGGFGVGLPGEGRGFSGGFGSTTTSSNKYAIDLTRRLAAGLPTATSLDQPDVNALFPGAPSAGARVRGKKGPFDGTDQKLIQQLKDAIIAMADKIGVFGEGKDSREELVRLTEKGISEGKSQTEILKDIYENAKEQINKDKELKEKFTEDKDLQKQARGVDKKIAAQRAEIAKQQGLADTSGDIAEQEIKKPREGSIIAGRQDEENIKATDLLNRLTTATDARAEAQKQLDEINFNINFEIGVLEASLNQATTKAAAALNDLGYTALNMMTQFVDIGDNFLDSALLLNTDMKKVQERSTKLEGDVADLQKQIQGK